MRKLYFFASLLIIACGSPKLISTPNPVASKSTLALTKVNFAKEENVANTLKFLASDDNEGRDSGSKGIEKASVFLENLMKENSIKPYFKTYRDTLSNFDKPAYNIVGYIEGNDPLLKSEFVIIGAHYDHIGKIAAVNGDEIANGANDNASGSTAVSEVMKYFANNNKNKRSLIFVFFSAEEKGLLGSKHLAKKLKAANLDLYFMFNFEMIGVPMQNKDFILYITGFGKTNMASKMNEYAGEKVIGYVPAETKYQLFRASDNYPFFTEFEVPAQTVSTFDFENFDFYHKPDDEFELMDTKHITNVVNTMIPVLEIMINKPTKEITINVK
jgi:Zn-dependent M28 family amino/carboxypeptidase